jgi:hypothetical protein
MKEIIGGSKNRAPADLSGVQLDTTLTVGYGGCMDQMVFGLK